MTNLFNLSDFLINAENFLGNKYIILLVASVSFFIKFYLITKLIFKQPGDKKTHASLIFLIVFIIGAMAADLGWIIKYTREIFLPFIDYRIQLFFIRIIWAFNVIQFHSLSLFIESLIKGKKLIGPRQKICLFMTSLIALSFLVIAFTKFNVTTLPHKEPVLSFLFKTTLFYNFYVLLLLSMIITLFRLRKAELPKILKKQIKIFLGLLIVPYITLEIISYNPFDVFRNFMNNQLAFTTITLILTTAAVFYSLKKVMCLKFLNMDNQQPSEKKFDFVHDFKNFLEQFSQVTSTKELEHITQRFFQSAFCIPTQKAHLYLRKLNKNQAQDEYKIISDYNVSVVETFINSHNKYCYVGKYLKDAKILVKDDIEFKNYYEDEKPLKKIIKFLQSISASLFIPIYEKDKLIAYIIIENHIRMTHDGKKSEFYTNEEKDQMLLFAKYLANMIHLLHNRNIKTLMKKEKELQEELFSKHQEINQYKECIRVFLNKNQDKKLGIVFYKNRQFIFGNKIAKHLIDINLNTNKEHPITKEFTKIAYQVLKYKSPQTSIINDTSENKLILYGLPHIEEDEVIIAIHYPEISDILKDRTNLLKDPSQWDYLLYLETTESGKLINKLVPGNGQTLLNFKIELLKIALSKQAILLDMAEQDLMPTVEILHHISLKEDLHVLNLQKPIKNVDMAIKLFGINPLFGLLEPNHLEPNYLEPNYLEEKSKSLLGRLDRTGTLFIKNIHFLDIESQKKLADFLRYGIYQPFKGEQTLSSNVRIICSTNINIKVAVQDGTFSQHLFNELSKTSVIMPPLMTLPEHEITKLTKGLTDQAMRSEKFKNASQLTDTEEKIIATSKPTSIQELKQRVQKLLEKKSKQKEPYEETSLYEYQSNGDPEIIEAARLGKHALKNYEIMKMLWAKFKNQNKIATLLGVNRSSINRRCKEYDLH